MSSGKRRIYHCPVTDEQLSAETTLKQMLIDREKLVRAWSLEVYEQRRIALEDYVKEKHTKAGKE